MDRLGHWCSIVHRSVVHRFGWSVAAVGLAVVGQPFLWAGSGVGPSWRPPLAYGGVLVVLVAGPLLAIRRSPVVALAVSATALLAYDMLAYPPSPADFAMLALLAWTVAVRRPAVGATATGVLTLAAAVVGALRPTGAGLAPVVASALVVPLAALVGVAGRAQRAAADLARREHDVVVAGLRLEAEQAAAVERLRLARELHDAVGHAVTLAGLRAEAAARLVVRDPPRAQELLTDIGRHTRGAMVELHQLVGVLRDAAEPPSSPARDLASIVARFSGPDFHVAIEDAVDSVTLPSGIEETVSSIVGEGLANAVRHSGARRAVVRLTHSGSELVVEVGDDGAGPPPGTRIGFGLAGAEERAQALGGRIDLGVGPAGGGLLRAILPWPHPLPPVVDVPVSGSQA